MTIVRDSIRWVFYHPFFTMLDVALDGNWPGNPVDMTTFSQTMLVN